MWNVNPTDSADTIQMTLVSGFQQSLKMCLKNRKGKRSRTSSRRLLVSADAVSVPRILILSDRDCMTYLSLRLELFFRGQGLVFLIRRVVG
eukprot:m.306984 g.306984  ORF g.306984 m.306984 type:complete len:91 (+) comp41796_c0_seq1:5736-6008(+)